MPFTEYQKTLSSESFASAYRIQKLQWCYFSFFDPSGRAWLVRFNKTCCNPSGGVGCHVEGAYMKRMKYPSKLERGVVAVLNGLTLCVAIVIAMIMTLGTPIELFVRWIHKLVVSSNLGASAFPRHP